MKGALVLLGLGLAAVLVLGQEAQKPIVDTHFGKLEGDITTSRDGRMFYQFKGIPYAKAPERFQIPEIPDHWEGVRDATKFGPECPQYYKTFKGEEDCLSLNVFTPKLPKEGEHKILLPVVVVLHPGYHMFGSGEIMGPKFFMDKDVIVVTVNSRLGLLGYLNTGDMYAQGNMGLKDQSQALRWVQQNIEKFGGDKGRVTLMGASSGGSDVMLHLLSPLSKGLFHNAIAQSGSPLSPSSFVTDPITQAKKLGEQVGCPTDSSQALVKCLKEMPVMDIMSKMTKPKLSEMNIDDVTVFGPSIEKLLGDQTENDVAISDIPYKLLTAGKIVNKVPLIMGINDHDGLTPPTAKLLNNTEVLAKLNENWETLAPKIFFFKKTAKDAQVAAKKIKEFYFKDQDVSFESKESLVSVFTDRFYAAPTRFTAKHYAKHAPVYLYYFNHKPVNTVVDGMGLGDKIKMGAGHLDELQYFFKGAGEFAAKIPEITKESDEKEFTLSNGMVTLWSSFIENGKPTKTWGEGKEWKKVETPEKPRWYKINLETKMLDEPEALTARMDFWHELYSTQLTSELMTPPEEKF